MQKFVQRFSRREGGLVNDRNGAVPQHCVTLAVTILLLIAMPVSNALADERPEFTPYIADLLVWKHVGPQTETENLLRVVRHRWTLERSGGPLPFDAGEQLNPADGYPQEDFIDANRRDLIDRLSQDASQLGDKFVFIALGPRLPDYAEGEARSIIGRSILTRPNVRVSQGGRAQNGSSPSSCIRMITEAPDELVEAYAERVDIYATSGEKFWNISRWEDLRFHPEYIGIYRTSMRSGRCWAFQQAGTMDRFDDYLRFIGGLPSPLDQATTQTADDAPPAETLHLIEIDVLVDDVIPVGNSYAFQLIAEEVRYFALPEEVRDRYTAQGSYHAPRVDPDLDLDTVSYFSLPTQAPVDTPVSVSRLSDRGVQNLNSQENAESVFDINGMFLGMSLTDAESLISERLGNATRLERFRPGDVMGDSVLFVSQDRREWSLLYHNSLDADAGVMAIQRTLLVPSDSAPKAALQAQIEEKYGPPRDLSGVASRQREAARRLSSTLGEYRFERSMTFDDESECKRVSGITTGPHFRVENWTGSGRDRLKDDMGLWFRLEKIRGWRVSEEEIPDCGAVLVTRISDAERMPDYTRLDVILMNSHEYQNSLDRGNSIASENVSVDIDL